jgi:hypothetical protein
MALGLTLLLVVVVSYRMTRSLWAVALSLVLCLCSRPLMIGYTRLMSEAAFLPVVMLVMWLLSVYVTTAKKRWLLAAAVGIAAAGFIRYAGMALVPVALAAIVLARGVPWKRRMIGLVVVLVIIGAAMQGWSMHQKSRTASGGRRLLYHPPGWSKIDDGARALGDWIAPEEISNIQWTGFAVGAVAAIGLPLLLRRDRAGSAAISVADMCGIFVVLYTTFVLISLTFFDAATPLNTRIWMPLVPPMAVLLGCATVHIVRSPQPIGWRIGTSIVLGTVIAVPLWYNVPGVWNMCENLHTSGQGYLAQKWRNSRLINWASTLPGDKQSGSEYQGVQA